MENSYKSIELVRDDGTREEVIGDGFIVTGAGGAGVNNFRTRDDLEIFIDEGMKIDQKYIKIVEQLCEKYTQVTVPRDAASGIICITVDTGWNPNEHANTNASWKVVIKKTPRLLRWVTGYEFELKLRIHWISQWSDAQLHAAILSQLLRINPSGDGSVLAYSVDFQDPLTATFGKGYLMPGVNIPDVLTEQIKIKNYREASGQITIDETMNGTAGDDGEDEPFPDGDDCEEVDPDED
ncbi:MAG: hypothetical protein FWF33_05310 [Clostridiales bacterium]|nr:hypothetical protein [Clostridiales bacterium]